MHPWVEQALEFHFFRGQFNGWLTHNIDRHGKIGKWLGGVRAYFLPTMPEQGVWFVLQKDEVQIPNDVVTPPPGNGPNDGGTPRPVAAVALAA